MSALLEVANLSKTFVSGGGLFSRAKSARVVTDVSFSLRRGDVFALVGESGSGKTTIGRMLLRLIEPDSGDITFDGIDLRSLAPAELRRLRRRIQIIFQDPFGSLDPRVRVGAAIAEPIRLHQLRPPNQVADRVAELLNLVGLDASHGNRFPHEFSGGQRQRVAIARALAVEPELIVCDEPVSALDLSIQAQVVNLLSELRARLGVSYVFISHDMAVVRHLATHVGVLYAGRLVETGPSETIFADPRHPYTRMLLAATPSPVPGAARSHEAITGEPPSPYAEWAQCRFASRCEHRIAACLAADPPLALVAPAPRLSACLRADVLPDFSAFDDGESRMTAAYRLRLDLLRRARAPKVPHV
ncbi:oligopeptide/dipeptide ABC transporter ATP-binding protein [Tardiphaga sp.]|uniref:ABC transporter ATP-binding protein n=1 Tax=Tardiphaga sp. TaxID=1926292 RepID=UPI0025E69BB0|nr:oligopeptide/dipeptide ABC transporter ATP-binding protein [Tardiphaga sp.]